MQRSHIICFVFLLLIAKHKSMIKGELIFEDYSKILKIQTIQLCMSIMYNLKIQ